MKTEILNNIKPITILLKEKDLASVKAILNFLRDKYPQFSIMKFRTGGIGEDILVSFKVHNDFYPKVLEKFAYNDIPIIMKDKSSLEFISEKKEQKRKKLRAQGWSEIIVIKRQLTLRELTRLSNEGKVKEVTKEARGGVGSKIEIINKAKKLLSETIHIAIENLVKYSEGCVWKKQEAIDQLLLIAADKDLKLFHKYDEICKAGLTAIELSHSHKNYYENLIKIANHSKLNNLINIKAVTTFADIYFNSSDEERDQLPNAIKLLNVRWLRIAYDTIQQKLSIEEREHFNFFIEFIENKRNAA